VVSSAAVRPIASLDKVVLNEAVSQFNQASSAQCLRVADPQDTNAWLKSLEQRLTLPSDSRARPLALDLFAGCGGLALGFEAAGFKTVGYEKDADACATYRKNLGSPCYQNTIEIGFDYGVRPDVIIGGPPCQPFSVIGYQRGPRDPRDGFPVLLDAVRNLRPKLVLIENVRGLLYRNKAYLDSVTSELRGFGYRVECRLLKAIDYGVPQNRERVIIAASDRTFKWPEATVLKPVSAGVALGRLALNVPEDARYLTDSQDQYIAAYERKSKCVRPRDLHLDRPARTITCRNIGGSTSDMHRIRLPDGRRRMLSLREGARLQSFPDWFEFVGSDYSIAKQIGNAVPPLMALELGLQAMKAIGEEVSVLKPSKPCGQIEMIL
jgi:site-specific DNA-cytosine methylase